MTASQASAREAELTQRVAAHSHALEGLAEAVGTRRTAERRSLRRTEAALLATMALHRADEDSDERRGMDEDPNREGAMPTGVSPGPAGVQAPLPSLGSSMGSAGGRGVSRPGSRGEADAYKLGESWLEPADEGSPPSPPPLSRPGSSLDASDTPQTPPWLRSAGEQLAHAPLALPLAHTPSAAEAAHAAQAAQAEQAEQATAAVAATPEAAARLGTLQPSESQAQQLHSPQPPSCEGGTSAATGSPATSRHVADRWRQATLETEVATLRQQLATTKVELAHACGERDEAHAQLRAGILEKKRAAELDQQGGTPGGKMGLFFTSPFRGASSGKP